MTQQFQVGKTYATRSICDHDTIFSFTILARTAKTVTIPVHNGKIAKRGLYIYEGCEQFKPYGSYSMCPIIGADDEVPEGLFTISQINQLRSEFERISTIDPSAPTYPKLIALLGGMTQPQLKQVCQSNIRFLSKLALNRIPREAA